MLFAMMPLNLFKLTNSRIITGPGKRCPSIFFNCKITQRKCHGQSSKDPTSANDGELQWQRRYYKYFLPIQTRWSDNDQYGHVNNVTYYSYFDTVINHYLVKHCGLNTDLKTSSMVGYMVDTNCVYRTPISFPEVALAGLGISHIGRSSVHYTVAIFPELSAQAQESSIHPKPGSSVVSTPPADEAKFGNHSMNACAVGHCIHVFVNTETNRPAPLPDTMRTALEKMSVLKETTRSKL